MKTHVCGVGELDYENVKDGFILCAVCGRMYRLTDKGWIANPPVVDAAAARAANWKKYKKR